MKKCGYVALLGRPNAGKSSLLNACVGAKIAAVSSKPQTTRHRILGVHNVADTQLLFLDTPGIHAPQGLPELNQLMVKTAWSVVEEADVVCYLIDVGRGIIDEDKIYLAALSQMCSKPILVVASKCDSVPMDHVRKVSNDITFALKELAEGFSVEPKKAKFAERIARITRVVESSAKDKERVNQYCERISAALPNTESPWLFNRDDLTDRSQNFVASELIREQLFRQTGAELPYQSTIRVDSFKLGEKGGITKIYASILVGKDSHKAMVIGKSGQKLKSIGTAARQSLERLLGGPVFLALNVKTHPTWARDTVCLTEYANLTPSPISELPY